MSNTRNGQWRHAVDRVIAGMWRELLDTRDLTTDTDIANAVTFGLDYSPHDREQDGYLSTNEARAILTAIGADEPEDRSSILLDMSEPRACKQEKGPDRWPLYSGWGIAPDTRAWSRILGIEAGWFARDRGGFLQWTQAGRDRYAAGTSVTYTEASGQSAFAF